MFILYFFAYIFVSKRNLEMFHRNSESDKTVQFLGQTEMRSETKFSTMGHTMDTSGHECHI